MSKWLETQDLFNLSSKTCSKCVFTFFRVEFEISFVQQYLQYNTMLTNCRKKKNCIKETIKGNVREKCKDV